jgi:glyoxylase-like metal-dependent hydrolase (beta-lactamase superfamily II)
VSTTVTIDAEYVLPQAAAVYLRVEDGEAAFIEANTTHAVPKLLRALSEQGLTPAAVKYIIVTHAHLDHAGGASALLSQCPQATLLCHPRAARNLIDPAKLVASAKRVYGEAPFAALYGDIAPIPAGRVRELADGATATLGRAPLHFLHTEGHARHHFVVHDESQAQVFTGDAFGLVYPRLQRARRFAFPSTSPIDFDAVEAHRSIDRVLALKPARVLPTHFGAFEDAGVIAAQLHRWIDVAQAAIDDCVKRGQLDCEAHLKGVMAREFEHATAEAGLTLDEGDRALLNLDVDLNAQGLAFVVSRRLAPPSPRTALT